MSGSIATSVVGQALLVASGVVVARALGPETRGVLALVVVVSAISTQVGSLGMPVAVTYYVANEMRSPKSVLRALRRFRITQLAATLTLQACAILIIVIPRAPSEYAWVALLSLAATASSLHQMYSLAVLQGMRRFRLFNFLRVLYVALYALGVVLLWNLGSATLVSVTLVIIGASIVAAAATSLAVSRCAGASDGAIAPPRSLLSFGLKSLFGSSPPLETFRLDQLVVGLVLSPIGLGFYTVSLAFTNLTRFIGQSIGMLTYPKVAAEREPEVRTQIIRHDALVGVAVCGSLTIGLVLGLPWLLPFFFGQLRSGYQSGSGPCSRHISCLN